MSVTILFCWFPLGQYVRSIVCVSLYSIWSLFIFIYSKNPFDNIEVERLLKRKEIADIRPTDWWRERKRDGEASCYEIPLWCSTTTWDEKCGLSSPVFWEKHKWKVPLFWNGCKYDWWQITNVFQSVFDKLEQMYKCWYFLCISYWLPFKKTWFVHRTHSRISTIPPVISLNFFIKDYL